MDTESCRGTDRRDRHQKKQAPGILQGIRGTLLHCTHLQQNVVGKETAEPKMQLPKALFGFRCEI